MIAAVNNHVWWYVSRSSGLVTWLLCAGSIVWGLALSTRALGKNPTPAWLLDLHRWLGTLAVVFVAIHIGAIVLDGTVPKAFSHYGWREVFIPLSRPANRWFKATAVAWGIVALYLLVAIQVTSWLRKHMSKKVWHTVHLLSFPLFVMSCVHAWQNGTDVRNRAVLWSALIVGMFVLAFTVMRLLSPKKAAAADRSAAIAAARARSAGTSAESTAAASTVAAPSAGTSSAVPVDRAAAIAAAKAARAARPVSADPAAAVPPVAASEPPDRDALIAAAMAARLAQTSPTPVVTPATTAAPPTVVSPRVTDPADRAAVIAAAKAARAAQAAERKASGDSVSELV